MGLFRPRSLLEILVKMSSRQLFEMEGWAEGRAEGVFGSCQ